MSLAATLVMAAAAALAPAPDTRPTRGVELVEARVTARILPAAAVRQASGPEPTGASRPRHQLTRRGNTVLVEFE